MNKLVFSDLEFGKKEFYGSKKAMKLGSVNVDKIVVSNKIKRKNEASKIFIGYMDDTDGIIRSLCIIIPQLSGWI